MEDAVVHRGVDEHQREDEEPGTPEHEGKARMRRRGLVDRDREWNHVGPKGDRERDVREDAYRLIPYLSLVLLVFLIVVFMYALGESPPVLNRWIERPYLLIFPFIGVVVAIMLALSVRRQSGRAALRNGQSYFRGCLLHARDLLLALHDSILDHDR